jgi:hypothetical protein
MVALFLFLTGMTGALAPFSYLVYDTIHGLGKTPEYISRLGPNAIKLFTSVI